MRGHIWLIGMMGSGKTTVGSLLADRVGLPFVDIDDVVARRAGCSVSRLWGSRGEGVFREMESAAVASAALGAPSVIATGGGAVLDAGSVAAMKRTGTVVWLEASVATLRARVAGSEDRPLLEDDPDAIGDLVEQRESTYSAAADITVTTDDADPDRISATIEDLWKRS